MHFKSWCSDRILIRPNFEKWKPDRSDLISKTGTGSHQIIRIRPDPDPYPCWTQKNRRKKMASSRRSTEILFWFDKLTYILSSWFSDSRCFNLKSLNLANYQNSIGTSRHKSRDEDPDPVIFRLPDPILFSLHPDPDHDSTCDNGYIIFILAQNIYQDQQIQP